MSTMLSWIWRLLVLAVIAYGVWGIWWQNVLLESINANLIQLLDYAELEPALIE